MIDRNNITELEIEMSTLCNAKCPLCYRNYNSFPEIYRKPVIRPLNEIISQLTDYVNLNYVMIVGSMSEPTLYPQLFELIEYLNSRNIEIEICTNGDTNNDEFWKHLGEILKPIDKVYFTICGSTQELHERYRKNTSLKNILHNAEIFRKQNPIDYAQCIRFNYNSDDFDTPQFKKMVSKFSHIYMTETFYPKHMDNYKNKFDIDDFIPNKVKIKKYDNVIKIAENISRLKFKEADCQSIEYHRQQIDVYGNIYPCYLHLEYMNGEKWDGDYNRINNLEYDCCKFCEKKVKLYCKMNNLEYII